MWSPDQLVSRTRAAEFQRSADMSEFRATGDSSCGCIWEGALSVARTGKPPIGSAGLRCRKSAPPPGPADYGCDKPSIILYRVISIGVDRQPEVAAPARQV